MHKGLLLGRLFGIDIRIHWSLIVIVMLVAWSLSFGLFEAWHPEWSIGLRWIVSLSAAILLFLSVLIHEFSHALVARKYGAPVRNITLFMFGGMADIESDPETPRREAVMAAIGPLTSIVLGIVFSVIASALVGPFDETILPEESMSQLGPIATLFIWLGPINIFIGIFNLMPGFPLDGGRILRSFLWASTKDLQRATRWASIIGQGFAWLLMVAGISMIFGARIPILGQGIVGGMWLFMISWFLNDAAIMSYRQVIIRNLLQDIPVGRLMRRQFQNLREDVTLDEFVDQYVMQTGQQVFPVVGRESGSIMGIVHANVLSQVPKSEWAATKVGQISIPLSDMPHVRPEEDAFKVMQELGRNSHNEVLVSGQDGEGLEGIIQREDIARWIAFQSQDSSISEVSNRTLGSE